MADTTGFAVGATMPVHKHHVTQLMIDRYAEASGDFNPIHVDPDYSANGPFGRTIAHGMMTMALAARMLNEWSGGRSDSSGEIEVAFIGPVFADDTIELSGIVEEIIERDGQTVARASITCVAGDRKILAGTVHQPFEPAEA